MKHTHKYGRDRLGKDYIIYRCFQPDCPHYVAEHLVIGRMSICWKCSHVFVINRKMSKLSKPHCDNASCYKDTAKVKDVDTDGLLRLLKGI